MPKQSNEFLKTWGVLIATVFIQIGMYIARDGRLNEDVKVLITEVKALNDFKAAYTVKVDSILEKVRWFK